MLPMIIHKKYYLPRNGIASVISQLDVRVNGRCIKIYHNNIQIGFTNMPDEIGGVAEPSIMTYYNQFKIVTR